MQVYSRQPRERGAALAVGMVLTLIIATMAGTMTLVCNQSLDMTRRRSINLQTFYVAEGVIQMVHGEIDRMYREGGGTTYDDLELIETPEFETHRVVDEEGGPGLHIALSGEPVFEELSSGAYHGLYAYKQRYIIDSTVSLAHHTLDLQQAKRQRFYTWAAVQEQIHALAIPLVQFVAFYDDTLEILPGPEMYMEGRVHSNSDMYIGCHDSLEFSAGISTVGDIYHGRYNDPNQNMSGSIQVADADGNMQSMQMPDGSWLDSSHSNWGTLAMQRWGGKLRSSDHRVPQLRLPIEFHEEPHQILERLSPADSPQLADVKFESKASLKIIEGQGYDQNNNPVPLTYPDPDDPSNTKSVISTAVWYDTREQKTVQCTDINVENLVESGLMPDGGVLYVDRNMAGSHEMDAVRVSNGAELPNGGLTVASPKPVYIRGDYNTVNKKTSLVAGDAVNILSNNWQDVPPSYNYHWDSLQYRQATDTTINTVLMTGKVSTIPNERYSGGFENLPRFTEDWSGETLTYRGGMICMWESEIATGEWSYGSPVYTAPGRDWRFDTMYNNPVNSPPGIPVVYTVEVQSYQHMY